MGPSSRALNRQVYAGVALFVLFFYAGCFKRIEPFYTFFYFFAWVPFLWIMDTTLAKHTGDSPLTHPRSFIRLALLSTTFWLVFEAFNFRLGNWQYIGVPAQRWLRWPGYALAFGTVLPGVFMLRKLIDSCLPRHLLDSSDSWAKITTSIPARHPRGSGGPKLLGMDSRFRGNDDLYALGSLMILLPMIWPRLFFPLIWGGVFLVLDPWVGSRNGHSLLADWRRGYWRATGTLLLAGILCGLFWEGCNFGAGSKWRYTLPYWEAGKVFEMPFLGFIGFLPFALEAHAFYEASRLFWRDRSAFQKRAVAIALAVFWLACFYGIDRWTVAGWRSVSGGVYP